jgi:hypothetical protein
VKSKHPWPRLSQTLPHRHPLTCQACGASFIDGGERLGFWQEHDDQDQPERIFVPLCQKCADRIIEPHPRLYEKIDRNAPMPGGMPICIDCRFRDGLRCTHADLVTNGGDGLRLTQVQPSVMFLDYRDKAARRRGKRIVSYYRPVSACAGRIQEGVTP